MTSTKQLIRLVPVVLVAVLAGCEKSQSKASADSGNSQVVQTAVVQMKSIGDVLEIPAKIQADPATVIHVYPPAGGRLLEVSVRPGDHVHKGQTVAIEQSSDVAQARADYSRAQTEFDKSNHALERAKLLFDHKVLSEREFEEAQADYAEAKGELDRSKGRLQILGVPVDGTSNDVAMLAPRSGAILDVGAAAGELSKSTDNANSIATIADLSRVWVIGDVYEKDLGTLKQGEPVQIKLAAYPGQSWTGRLAVISDALDPQTRTLKIRVELNNPGEKLKPEMFATILVQRPQREAIVIPAAAVLHEGGDTSVMVQTKPGSYERRLVSIGSVNGESAVVTSGLKPGEVVVSEGAALVRGGEEQ